MSASKVRVRFAPSPTGYLHVGGARTALFNWLFAKANEGTFLLRIEDTDLLRSQKEFTQDIIDSLKWLGFEPEEPILYQSSRMPIYQETAQKLISEGKAYYCQCSQSMLEAIREQCIKEKRPYRYPGFCRDKHLTSEGRELVVRVTMPKLGETRFSDLIRGEIAVQNKELEDWVILRKDGSPTYNFCVVIDDALQQVSHVLRGEDHISNTPKQLALYELLQMPAPKFGHFPMILGGDKVKLSKRHGAVSTLEYRTEGYLPDALINFLVRLGWSHQDQEIFTIEELKKYFSLDKVGKASAVFNRDKLIWLNGHFMRSHTPQYLLDYLSKFFEAETKWMTHVTHEKLLFGVSIIQGKVKTVLELIAQMKCLFGEDPEISKEDLSEEERQKIKNHLLGIYDVILSGEFSKEELESRIKGYVSEKKLSLKDLAQAIRFAVTGGQVSPSLFEMLTAQGETVVRRRFDRLIELF